VTPSSPGLKPDEDAYGQIYLALLEGERPQEIMERDDGLIYAGDPADYFAPYRRWPSHEKRAMRWVRGRVLDAGCGAGRVSLHLQERGHDVVAIDESPLAVEVARRRGVRQAAVRRVTDLSPAERPFDTILLLRNNVGLAGDDAAIPSLLGRLHELATARGRIITDSVFPERIDDPHYWTYRLPDGTTTRTANPRYRVRWQHFATPWFRYLILNPETFAARLAGSGWHIRAVIDTGAPRYNLVLERARGRSAGRSI
jgi:SAM-dependent methyltransferase